MNIIIIVWFLLAHYTYKWQTADVRGENKTNIISLTSQQLHDIKAMFTYEYE